MWFISGNWGTRWKAQDLQFIKHNNIQLIKVLFYPHFFRILHKSQPKDLQGALIRYYRPLLISGFYHNSDMLGR